MRISFIYIYISVYMHVFSLYIPCTCQVLPKPSGRKPSTVEGLGMVTPSPVRAAPSPSSVEPINLEDNDLIS